MSYLELKSVSKSFNKKTVLDNISLSINKNDLIGIVGESGSGKTTLSRIILKLLGQYEGSVLFEGKDISIFNRNELKEFRKKTQIIFQDPIAALSPRMKVGMLLDEASKNKQRSWEMLLLMGLPEAYYDKYPHELSGGEAQRICIARALAMDPELLILDEPVSSLDQDLSDTIIDLLIDIKKTFNLTYVFITHDINMAQRTCNKIAVMKNGCVVEFQETDKLFNSPISEYTKTLIEYSN